jgi:hypothetical protein
MAMKPMKPVMKAKLKPKPKPTVKPKTKPTRKPDATEVPGFKFGAGTQ